jgi:hypothetical protein
LLLVGFELATLFERGFFIIGSKGGRLRKKHFTMPPPRHRKSDSVEPVPLWSWTVLMALAAMSVGMWYPVLEHWRRQTMGWSLLAIILAWVVRFGSSTVGLLLACMSAVCILFGTLLTHKLMILWLFFAIHPTILRRVRQDKANFMMHPTGGPMHMSSQLGYNSVVRIASESGMDIDAKGLLVISR